MLKGSGNTNTINLSLLPLQLREFKGHGCTLCDSVFTPQSVALIAKRKRNGYGKIVRRTEFLPGQTASLQSSMSGWQPSELALS